MLKETKEYSTMRDGLLFGKCNETGFSKTIETKGELKWLRQ